MERARLGKGRRLRTASEFARVRQFGRSYATMLLSVNVARQQAMTVLESPQLVAPTRVGFSVGKRVGDAVVRNRVRRRLREIMRARLGQLAPGWDVVVAARPPAAESPYSVLDEELQRLLTRAKVLAPGSEARHV